MYPQQITALFFSLSVFMLTNTHADNNLSVQELLNQAHNHIKNNQLDQALVCCNQAVAQENNNFRTHFYRGVVLSKNKETEQALRAYQRSLELNSTNLSAVYNIAYTLKDLGREQEAIPLYLQVIEKKPDHAHAHLGLAQSYLALGNFQNGWKEFSWRSSDIRKFKQYDWSNDDLLGKKILVRCEWGMGDVIQFIRYAKLLKERGATVIMQSYPQLLQILSCCPYIDTIVTASQPLPEHDIQIPLLSLPQTFNTTLATTPRKVPYLFPDPQLIEHWHKKLTHDTKLKIGICWHGRENSSTPPRLNRNIPLSLLLSLAELKNVSLYSLQKSTGLDELNTISADSKLNIFDQDFDETNGPFMDTAAVMKNLDLVITIDTSIAHLAGALGVPTWLVLPSKADWRWMKDRSDSPWYPTMRLFRQTEPGNWEDVMTAIENDLRIRIKEII